VGVGLDGVPSDRSNILCSPFYASDTQGLTVKASPGRPLPPAPPFGSRVSVTSQAADGYATATFTFAGTTTVETVSTYALDNDGLCPEGRMDDQNHLVQCVVRTAATMSPALYEADPQTALPAGVPVLRVDEIAFDPHLGAFVLTMRAVPSAAGYVPLDSLSCAPAGTPSIPPPATFHACGALWGVSLENNRWAMADAGSPLHVTQAASRNGATLYVLSGTFISGGRRYSGELETTGQAIAAAGVCLA
jgi:hypothetical protein